VQLLLSNYDAQSSNVENVPVSFLNVLPGEYQLRQQFLGGQTLTTSIATTSAILQTSVIMPVNSVALLELQLQTPLEPVIPTPAPPTPTPTIETGLGRLIGN
jgi:hypothetical protein